MEQERIQILASFMQDAAHEFRTPLAIVVLSANLLMRANDPEQQVHYQQRIEQQVQTITKLVDSLAMMAKLDASYVIESGVLHVNRVVQIAWEQAQHEVPTKFPVIFQFDEHDPTLHGDPSLLGRALLEICENALRYSSDAGQVTITTSRNAHQDIVIRVQDSGRGIAPELLPRIFERFFREDTAHTERGFGLGLPIAKRIIELHGGTIQVDSILGQGTQVEIILPI